MTQILNVSAYKFVALDDCPALRERLLTGAAACAACGGAPLAAADARHPDDDAVETARRRYRAAPVTPGEAR